MKAEGRANSQISATLPHDVNSKRWHFMEMIYSNYDEISAQQKEVAARKSEMDLELIHANKDAIRSVLLAEGNRDAAQLGDWETFEHVQHILKKFVYSRSQDMRQIAAAEMTLNDRIDFLNKHGAEQRERILGLEKALKAVQEETAGFMDILQIKERELRKSKDLCLLKSLQVSQLERECKSLRTSTGLDEKEVCKDMRMIIKMNKKLERENTQLRAAVTAVSTSDSNIASLLRSTAPKETGSKKSAKKKEPKTEKSKESSSPKDGPSVVKNSTPQGKDNETHTVLNTSQKQSPNVKEAKENHTTLLTLSPNKLSSKTEREGDLNKLDNVALGAQSPRVETLDSAKGESVPKEESKECKEAQGGEFISPQRPNSEVDLLRHNESESQSLVQENSEGVELTPQDAQAMSISASPQVFDGFHHQKNEVYNPIILSPEINAKDSNEEEEEDEEFDSAELSDSQKRAYFILQQAPITGMMMKMRREREAWLRRLEAEVRHNLDNLDFDAGKDLEEDYRAFRRKNAKAITNKAINTDWEWLGDEAVQIDRDTTSTVTDREAVWNIAAADFEGMMMGRERRPTSLDSNFLAKMDSRTAGAAGLPSLSRGDDDLNSSDRRRGESMEQVSWRYRSANGVATPIPTSKRRSESPSRRRATIKDEPDICLSSLSGTQQPTSGWVDRNSALNSKESRTATSAQKVKSSSPTKSDEETLFVQGEWPAAPSDAGDWSTEQAYMNDLSRAPSPPFHGTHSYTTAGKPHPGSMLPGKRSELRRKSLEPSVTPKGIPSSTGTIAGEVIRLRKLLEMTRKESRAINHYHSKMRAEMEEYFRLLRNGLHALSNSSDDALINPYETCEEFASKLTEDIVKEMVEQRIFERLEEEGVVLQRHTGASKELTDEEWAQNKLYDAVATHSRDKMAELVMQNSKKQKRDKTLHNKGSEFSARRVESSRRHKPKESAPSEKLNPGQTHEKNSSSPTRLATVLQEAQPTDSTSRKPKTHKPPNLSPFDEHISNDFLYHLVSQDSHEKEEDQMSFAESERPLGVQGSSLACRPKHKVNSQHPKEYSASHAGKVPSNTPCISVETDATNDAMKNISYSPGRGRVPASGMANAQRHDGNFTHDGMMDLANSSTHANAWRNDGVVDTLDELTPKGVRYPYRYIRRKSARSAVSALLVPVELPGLDIHSYDGLKKPNTTHIPRPFDGNILDYLRGLQPPLHTPDVANMAPRVLRYDFQTALERARERVRDTVRLAVHNLRGPSFENQFGNNIMPYVKAIKGLQNGKQMVPWVHAAIRQLRKEEERRRELRAENLFNRVVTNLRTRSLLRHNPCRGSAFASYVIVLWEKWKKQNKKEKENLQLEEHNGLQKVMKLLGTKPQTRQSQPGVKQPEKKSLFTDKVYASGASSNHFSEVHLPKKTKEA